MLDGLLNFMNTTGVAALINQMKVAIDNSENILSIIGTPIMIIIACILIYLAIVKQYEPLLLLPIAFGMLLTNLPMFSGSSAIMMHNEFFTDPKYLVDGKYLDLQLIVSKGGLLDLLYLGVKLGIYPPLIPAISPVWSGQ